MTIALWIYGHTSSSTVFVCNYWEDEHFIMHADCSGLNLRLVPVLSGNVSYLDLSTNLMNVIENKTFSNLSILHELNLSYNQLEWLDQDRQLVMLELVENDSYIEYPKDEQGNIVFWDKLKEAMT
ncbi:Hypothetical predicted protein [Mytilus galloprovincialis]|uniref:Uncharacterized protein n=1 Tax=Mytilus galloprovincialis TaxID=29158 RepID=A0A8B6F9F8_MYTGA|nr:Hypothetical predicted protein [Mytilus galloprovincialis]